MANDPELDLTTLADLPLPADWDDTLAPRLTDVREIVLTAIEDITLNGTPTEIQAMAVKLAPILFRKQTDTDQEAVLEAARLELRTMIERAGASCFPDYKEES